MLREILKRPSMQSAILTVFCSLVLSAAIQLLTRIESVSHLCLALLIGVVSYALADLVSGIVHWLADHYGHERTPLVGYMFIEPFRAHHEDPEALINESWSALCIHAALTAAPAVFFSLACTLSLPNQTLAVLFGTAFLITPLGGVFACATHRWAHDESAPAVARKLQRMGLILRPAHHTAHHRDGHLTSFCILNGWMNPILDPVIKLIETRTHRQSPRRSHA